MTRFNMMGNKIFSFLVRNFYPGGLKITDVLTGYFAWKRESIEQLQPHLTSDGFALEMEMVTKMIRLKQEICCVPISYNARAGSTNLHPIYDGLRILRMFARNLFWKPETNFVVTKGKQNIALKV